MNCDKCSSPYIIAGAAMTDWECENCGKKSPSGSTRCPELCDACSAKLQECKYCRNDKDKQPKLVNTRLIDVTEKLGYGKLNNL